MKTRDDIRFLALKIIKAVGDAAANDLFISLNRQMGATRLTLVRDDQVKTVWEALRIYASRNCPQVLNYDSPLELAKAHVAFLRARWRLRMDEDAPEFVP